MTIKVTRTKDRQYFVIKNEGVEGLPAIRALPGRKWNDAIPQAWTVPYCSESWDALVTAKFVTPTNRPDDLVSGYTVTMLNGVFAIRTLGTADDITKCKRIPEQRSYDASSRLWFCKPTQTNVAYIRKNFPQLVWDGTAEHIADAASLKNQDPHPEEIVAANAAQQQLQEALGEEITDYFFYTAGYQHQVDAFKLSRHLPTFALFMEQGTGKGWIIVNTAAYQFQQGKINALLVICPNAMKEPWVEELGKHLAPGFPLDIFMWEAKTRHKAEEWVLSTPPGLKKLRVLIMNFEALAGDIGGNIAKLFLTKHQCFFTVDESSKIKSSVAARTKRIVTLGKHAGFRRIMSGTPVTQGPLDLFPQLRFLDPKILGYSTFYSFRSRYAVLGGWQGRQIIKYQYLDELQAKVAAHSFRVLKINCLDLPPKVYEKRIIELTDEQRAIYARLDQEMAAEVVLEDGRIAQSCVMLVITKIMRMQQVIGGFLTVDANEDLDLPQGKPMPIFGGNPKLDALMDIIDEAGDQQKVIIWARFRPELQLIATTLRAKYGNDSVIEFHGGIKDAERQQGRRDFQDRSSLARFLVGQPKSGGIGTTFTAASLMVYYSNDYSLETRMQSEDRFHRIGQTALKCTIIDIVAKNTWDYKIVNGFRLKKSLADIITGDPTISWV